MARPRPSSAPPTRVRRTQAGMRALREQLLAQARAIYQAEGLEALSMRRLAQDAGLSPMTLYSYFPSKQALLESVWIEVFEALVDHLLTATASKRTPRTVLEAHLRAFIAFWEDRPDQYRLIYLSAQTGSGQEAVDMSQQPVYARFVGLMRERVAACLPERLNATGKQAALRSDLATTKLVGYLQVTLGIRRYQVGDQDALREAVVRDILCATLAADA